LNLKASTTEGLSFDFCRQRLATAGLLSLLQDLGTEVQAFFSSPLKRIVPESFLIVER